MIVLSESKVPDDIRDTYDAGVDGYFVEPTAPNEFIAAVRTLCEAVADDGDVPDGAYADFDPET